MNKLDEIDRELLVKILCWNDGLEIDEFEKVHGMSIDRYWNDLPQWRQDDFLHLTEKISQELEAMKAENKRLHEDIRVLVEKHIKRREELEEARQCRDENGEMVVSWRGRYFKMKAKNERLREIAHKASATLLYCNQKLKAPEPYMIEEIEEALKETKK